jgi:hypothetical protein
MNDDSLHDPQLQSFEARLASRSPQVSAVQRDNLLYACAFAAGQQAAVRPLRRWRLATAALSVVLVGAMIPYVREPPPIPRQPIERHAITEPTPPRKPVLVESGALAHEPAVVHLDAWQMRTQSGESLTEQLCQLEKTDPHLRSLAVGVLTQAALKP